MRLCILLLLCKKFRSHIRREGSIFAQYDSWTKSRGMADFFKDGTKAVQRVWVKKIRIQTENAHWFLPPNRFSSNVPWAPAPAFNRFFAMRLSVSLFYCVIILQRWNSHGIAVAVACVCVCVCGVFFLHLHILIQFIKHWAFFSIFFLISCSAFPVSCSFFYSSWLW